MPNPTQAQDTNMCIAAISEPVPRHMGVRFVSIVVALQATKKNGASIELNVEDKMNSGIFKQVALCAIPPGAMGCYRSTLQWPIPGGCRYRVDTSGAPGVVEAIEATNFVDY